jgi:competence ComEA-like helix-hairpin-helix protein
MKKVLLLLCIILISNAYALCEEGQIDINTASLEELDNIIGIGPAYAERIIQSRPFNSVDDLINVSGIGEITLKKIKNQSLACVGNEEEISEETEEDTQEEETNEIEEDISQNETTEKGISENNEKLINNKEPAIIEINTKEIKNTTEKEAKTIVLTSLTPKDIKSNPDKEQLNKNKLAIHGLIAFCILLAFLFIKKKEKRKK